MILAKRPYFGPALGLMGGSLLLLGAAFVSQAAPPGATKKPTTSDPPTRKLSYNRDIRPILAENCFRCHGPDSAARKADLRLDRPADATAMRGDHAPIVKGKPEASEMILRITGQHSLMPPPASHKTLTP